MRFNEADDQPKHLACPLFVSRDDRGTRHLMPRVPVSCPFSVVLESVKSEFACIRQDRARGFYALLVQKLVLAGGQLTPAPK